MSLPVVTKKVGMKRYMISRYIIILCLGAGICFLLHSCRRNEKAKTEHLCEELKNTAMSTPAFDSLMNASIELPKSFRARVLLTAGSRYGMRTDQMIQARKYLREALEIAPRDIKNKVTLELARLYGTLVVRDDCSEEAIRFMSEAHSKVVFARGEEADFYYLKAKFFKSVNLDRAFAAVDQALLAYRGLSDTRGEMETYRFKATLYGVLEDYEQQYACYEEAYRLFKMVRNNEEIQPFFEQMAACLKKLGRYEEALFWYDEVLKTAKDTNDMGRFGIQIAGAYTGLGCHGKARELLKQGLTNEKRGGLRNVLLGRIADSFLNEGERDSALVYFEAAIEFYNRYAREKNLKISGVMFMNHLNYARCLWDAGRRETALQYLEVVSRFEVEVPESMVSQMKVLKQLCEYYEELERGQEYGAAYCRRDSIMEIYQASHLDRGYRGVLQKYKNKKLLQEIESMNQKRETINWWLVLSLVVTIGLVAGVSVYAWVFWRKQSNAYFDKEE